MEQSLSSYMTRSPLVADPSQDLSSAMKMMQNQDFRHLPVVKDNRIVGIVSVADLREALALPQAPQLKLEDIMKTAVYAVPAETPLHEVVRDMADLKTGSALVTNSSNEIVGLFTTTDALKLLSEILEEKGSEAVDLDEYVEPWALDLH